MQVKDIMTKDVVTVNTNDSIYEVAKKMRKHNIGCIPVLEGGEKVMGVITDRDIALNISRYADETSKVPASAIMSNKIYSVKPDVDTKYALDLMKKQRIRRLAVMENEMLLGMISIGDLAVKGKCDMEVSEALTEISKPIKR